MSQSSPQSPLAAESVAANFPALADKFGRTITYARIAVTDRCNLRCVYCMPEKMHFLPREEILSFEEIVRLCRILAGAGVNKIRITGGEPFLRKDLMQLLWRIREIPGIARIHITTNGVLTTPHLEELHEMDIAGINLSLDTLDEKKFSRITRRDAFKEVIACFQRALELEIPLKINMVVMKGYNEDEVGAMADLSRRYPVDVRFIEEMPFNGCASSPANGSWDYRQILGCLQQRFPDLEKLPDEATSTSMNYRIPGHLGSVGIIAGRSRLFCGSCNRIRLTARGVLQTCLYGEGALNLLHMLRTEDDDQQIVRAIAAAVQGRARNGFEAESRRQRHGGGFDSMSLIGG